MSPFPPKDIDLIKTLIEKYGKEPLLHIINSDNFNVQSSIESQSNNYELLDSFRNDLDSTIVKIPKSVTESVVSSKQIFNITESEFQLSDIEDDDLLSGVGIYFDLLDSVLSESNDGYNHLTPVIATDVGLTPSQTATVNIVIDEINSTITVLHSTMSPLLFSRHQVVFYLAVAAMNPGKMMPGLSALLRLLKLLLKFLKWLISGKKKFQKN